MQWEIPEKPREKTIEQEIPKVFQTVNELGWFTFRSGRVSGTHSVKVCFDAMNVLFWVLKLWPARFLVFLIFRPTDHLTPRFPIIYYLLLSAACKGRGGEVGRCPRAYSGSVYESGHAIEQFYWKTTIGVAVGAMKKCIGVFPRHPLVSARHCLQFSASRCPAHSRLSPIVF